MTEALPRRLAAGVASALAVVLLLAAAIGGVRLGVSLSAWLALSLTTVALAVLASRMIGWHLGAVAGGLFVSMPLLLQNTATLPASLILIEVMWLAAVDSFQRTDNRRWLIAAAIILAAGMALDADALIVLPALGAGTALTLLLIDRPSPLPARSLLLPVVAGAAAIAPLAIYLAMHPEWIAARANAYGLYDAQRFNPLQGVREITSWVGLTARSETYWHYLDPAFLFLSGGVFLVSTSVLLAVGIAKALAQPQRLQTLLVIGLLAAPLPGALLVRGPVAARFMPAAPFAALLMALGLHCLWTSDRPWHRALGFATALVLAGNVLAVAYGLALRS
jgi:hypothetical protein